MFLLTSSSAFVQTIPRVRIVGWVVDASNGQPLHFANVFLSGTTIGAATDEEGRFSIVNVPLGTYELVVSMMGYDLQVMKVEWTEPVDLEFHFQLKPKTLKAPTLEVTAPRPKAWEKHLKSFHRMFFGSTENADLCEIVNPEVLDFTEDKPSDTFTAVASGPLEIVNRGLGYRIQFYLEEFVRRGDHLHSSGKSIFEPLESQHPNEENEWRKNRHKAFYGSLRHFFIALLSNRWEEEGFCVKNDFRRYRWDANIYLSNISTDNLLQPCQREFEKKLFFADFLRVIYTKEEFPKEDRWGNKLFQQTSWLRMNTSMPAIINSLGLVHNSGAVTQYGYWAKERFAEELPLDYIPEE